jgi:hypothetical protein
VERATYETGEVKADNEKTSELPGNYRDYPCHTTNSCYISGQKFTAKSHRRFPDMRLTLYQTLPMSRHIQRVSSLSCPQRKAAIASCQISFKLQ